MLFLLPLLGSSRSLSPPPLARPLSLSLSRTLSARLSSSPRRQILEKQTNWKDLLEWIRRRRYLAFSFLPPPFARAHGLFLFFSLSLARSLFRVLHRHAPPCVSSLACSPVLSRKALCFFLSRALSYTRKTLFSFFSPFSLFLSPPSLKIPNC